MAYVARTKQARKRLSTEPRPVLRGATLECGHTVDRAPELSNPDRWWCCTGWQRRKR